MTKSEAIKAIVRLSYGTIATLSGYKRYDDIDRLVEDIVAKIENSEIKTNRCKNWQDVWNKYKKCSKLLIIN